MKVKWTGEDKIEWLGAYWLAGIIEVCKLLGLKKAEIWFFSVLLNKIQVLKKHWNVNFSSYIYLKYWDILCQK